MRLGSNLDSYAILGDFRGDPRVLGFFPMLTLPPIQLQRGDFGWPVISFKNPELCDRIAIDPTRGSYLALEMITSLTSSVFFDDGY